MPVSWMRRSCWFASPSNIQDSQMSNSASVLWDAKPCLRHGKLAKPNCSQFDHWSDLVSLDTVSSRRLTDADMLTPVANERHRKSRAALLQQDSKARRAARRLKCQMQTSTGSINDDSVGFFGYLATNILFLWRKRPLC